MTITHRIPDNNRDDDDSSSSVDTQDALLDLLGLSSHAQGGSPDDTKSPPLSSILVMDEEACETIVSDHPEAAAIPIALPPKCSRYGHVPEDCAAVIIPGFYSPAECQALLQLGQRTGFQYITQASHVAPDGSTYTVQLQNPNPHKLAVLEHPPTIAGLWHKLVHSHHVLQADWMTRYRARTGYAAAVGLNPRVRVLQYDASDNDRFEAHFDATTQVKAANGSMQTSRLTVLLYLNTGGGVDFEGGETLYLDAPIMGSEKPTLVQSATTTTTTNHQVKVVPQQGTLVVFEHNLFHAGAPLVRGTKHVMRTDILFDLPEEDAWGECPNNQTTVNDSQDDVGDDPNQSTTGNSVLDLCQEMNWSPEDQSVLQDMGLLDMTLESFLVPGTAILTELLTDGGIDGSFLRDLLKVAKERVLGGGEKSTLNVLVDEASSNYTAFCREEVMATHRGFRVRGNL
eukprot:scaffold3339_cov174-Amphora_coffeaeformis.AAC.16